MADQITVRSNFHHVDIIYGWQLTEKEKRQFSYSSLAELHEASFFRYKGRVHDMEEFSIFQDKDRPDAFKKWEAYSNDTYSSGLVIRFAPDTDYECLQVGYWFC